MKEPADRPWSTILQLSRLADSVIADLSIVAADGLRVQAGKVDQLALEVNECVATQRLPPVMLEHALCVHEGRDNEAIGTSRMALGRDLRRLFRTS